MSKFFVKTEQINNNDIVIIGDDVNHIINVLRMKKTDEIQICNQDTGDNYNAEIVNYSKNEVECKIISKINETTESNVHITLFQGIPKFEKMELIIQKNTEVGIKSIVPVIMERTVVKLDEKIAKLMNMISLEDMSTLMNAPMPMEFALAFNKGMMK